MNALAVVDVIARLTKMLIDLIRANPSVNTEDVRRELVRIGVDLQRLGDVEDNEWIEVGGR